MIVYANSQTSEYWAAAINGETESSVTVRQSPAYAGECNKDATLVVKCGRFEIVAMIDADRKTADSVRIRTDDTFCGVSTVARATLVALEIPFRIKWRKLWLGTVKRDTIERLADALADERFAVAETS